MTHGLLCYAGTHRKWSGAALALWGVSTLLSVSCGKCTQEAICVGSVALCTYLFSAKKYVLPTRRPGCTERYSGPAGAAGSMAFKGDLLVLEIGRVQGISTVLSTQRQGTPSQAPGSDANTSAPLWLGNDACSSRLFGIFFNFSFWDGITCTNGRVTSMNLSGYGASGPLELLGPLTAVYELNLYNNSFEGDAAESKRQQESACCCSGFAQPPVACLLWLGRAPP